MPMSKREQKYLDNKFPVKDYPTLINEEIPSRFWDEMYQIQDHEMLYNWVSSYLWDRRFK